MLDVMRRKKGFVRVILSVVVVAVAGSFAFALYGIWGGALTEKEQGAPNWIATVDGEEISTSLFQRQRGLLLQEYRDQFAGQGLDEETIAAFVDRQALGALLGTYLARMEAERSNLEATGPEVRDAVEKNFQRDGRFVGVQQYLRQLRSYGLQPAEFERQLGEEIEADKLKTAVASLARVDDAEVDRRFHSEVERVDVNYVLLADSAYADEKAPTESDLRAYFTSHAASYVTPEGRRSVYVLFDREAKAASMQVPEEDLKDYYEKNKATLYSHKDQRRASHILIKLDPLGGPEKDAESRAKAEATLARVRGGEDFATVARQVSEDPGSAPTGGDLGFFERGRMVKEFEEATFSLAVGTVSGVVKSPFGYHVIKVTDNRPSGVQPFEEVRDEIRRTLGVQRAQEAIRKEADAFTGRLGTQEASFDKTAAEAGYTVADTGFFGKGEPAGALGRLPQVDEAVFSLSPGATSQALAVPQGLAVFALAEIRKPEPAAFETVRESVEKEFKQSRARDRARRIAAEILATNGNLAARVTKQRLEVKSYPAVNRAQPLPPLTDASKTAAFAATPGSVLGPFESGDGLVIIEVTGKKPATPEEAAAERADLAKRLLDEERSALFQVFLARLQKNAKIEVNDALLQRGRPAR